MVVSPRTVEIAAAKPYHLTSSVATRQINDRPGDLESALAQGALQRRAAQAAARLEDPTALTSINRRPRAGFLQDEPCRMQFPFPP
jgi:hypothetical protein